MPTLPTAFAETTKRSLNSGELSQRVLSLYRKYLRSAPVFIELYELDLPVGVVRTKIRQEFERNRFQKDININNVLLAKGQMEYQELINFWKQTPHVMRYFEFEGDTRFSKDAKIADSFVGKFLKGFWLYKFPVLVQWLHDTPYLLFIVNDLFIQPIYSSIYLFKLLKNTNTRILYNCMCIAYIFLPF